MPGHAIRRGSQGGSGSAGQGGAGAPPNAGACHPARQPGRQRQRGAAAEAEARATLCGSASALQGRSRTRQTAELMRVNNVVEKDCCQRGFSGGC